jgi:isopenicillin N synthase-like dioxygenase
MSNVSEIPIISIAALRSDDRAKRILCAKRIGQACHEVGFFYVVDHGVDLSLVKQAFATAAAFFALPTEAKMLVSRNKSRRHRGYFALRGEITNPLAGPDRKEGFDILLDPPTTAPQVRARKPFRGLSQWPAAPADFRVVLTAYYKSLCKLGTLISRGFDLALDLPENFFAGHLRRPTAILRILHYPPSERIATRAAAANRDGGAGAHTDNGYLTILAQDDEGGLQVQNTAGRWIDALPIEGSFVCNLGGMMARWTDNMMRATPHRVIHRSLNSRYSIPFFFHPDLGVGRVRRKPLVRKDSVRFLT